MPMAVVGPASSADRAAPALPAHPAPAAAAAAVPVQPPAPVIVTDGYAKDVMLSWFRSEFAAANAIIDALCSHLSQLGGVPDYEAVFQAVHRRRMNWVPVLHMQEFHPVAEVVVELTKVAARKLGDDGNKAPMAVASSAATEKEPTQIKSVETLVNDEMAASESAAAAEKALEMNTGNDSGNGEVIDEEEDSPDSDITDSGSQEVHHVPEEMELCSNHELCESRLSQIKLTKGFAAKEPVRGHMVNLVKGLKLYENVFTNSEVAKLTHFVTDLRTAGQNGELSGETYILFNKQIKGNKRELLQFGVPIFGHRQEDAMGNNETSNIQPIPSLLQGVIDHLVQWQLLPVYKQPNSCIINFFDEGEYSQPFWKPPHLDQPISTLFLSESTLVFGRFLVNDGEGNYKAKFTLTPKEGSFLVMRGNSCDMARHATCPSPNKRIAISFFKVRPDSNPTHSANGALTLWNPTPPVPYSYEPMDMTISNWGLLPAPVVMLAQVPPMAVSPKKMLGNGTGVFLPWNGSQRKPGKHLPPRAQRRRFLHLTQAVETHVAEPASA